ncbi:carbamoyltransferase [Elusimicrobiota bacterium]
MYILGISCWYHDSAAALIEDGRLIACSEEERFSRKKHDFNFPELAIKYCLEKAGIETTDIDYIVFYDKPLVKFDRILSSILKNVPRSLSVFKEAVPLWIKEKLHFRRKVRKRMKIKDENKILFCTHHKAHAASSFFLSPFKESAILTVDGVGEWSTATLGYGKDNHIHMIEELHFPHSLGLLYSAFTAFLGFTINNGEYKVMGMSPYGEPRFYEKVKKVAAMNDDGSIELNMDYFCFEYSTSKTFNGKFVSLFGEPRDPDSLFYTLNTGFPVYYGAKPDNYEELAEKNQVYADIAASIQKFLEDALIKIVRHLKEKTGSENLCYSGGVALNSKANNIIVQENIFDDIFIQPAATDAGGALGAALWCWCEVLDNDREEVLEHSYYGKAFSEEEIRRTIEDNSGLISEKCDDNELYDRITAAIIEGKVIAWYQGKTEWGPRALGNRSIIADPREAEMKNIINKVIKFREPYRPFAPSILEEDVSKYIEIKKHIYPDRFMLVTYPVKEEMKDVIPAVTHINGTSRIQIVKKKYNLKYWSLINRFKEKTGIGLLLNTSFNLKGEPIVNSPEDAVQTFMNSGLDILVMGNYIVKKKKDGEK